MAYILLTRENFTFLKNQLKPLLSEVKSAHLSEALAACAHFKTHAALLAACKNCIEHHPDIIEPNGRRLFERLNELGYTVGASIDINAICRSPNLPTKMWLSFSNTDTKANNRWFNECRERNIPNLCIRERRKYVELRWDCISIDTEYETHVTGDEGTQLVGEMFDTFQSRLKGMGSKAVFDGSSFAGSVDNLLPKSAYDLADQFFVKLYEPMRKQLLAA